MTMDGGRACGFLPGIGSSGAADNFTTLMEIKRFDYKTKVKARSERQNL